MKLGAMALSEGVLRGDRVMLARAITTVESELPQHRAIAEDLLDAVLPHSGKSIRVGITGVPGAGKSTFIDALGSYLTDEHSRRVAVLSVDPSSEKSGGSILGDKTRMERLAANESAFVRPSPSRGNMGGVARHTREAVLLCEAAGYDTVLIETVGVGQSETAVHAMTDFFLLLMIPGAGDELQGIKRGIIEMLDGMVINKADGENKARAEQARAEYSRALQLIGPGDEWRPPVMTCSALTGEGIGDTWSMIAAHHEQQVGSGRFVSRRRAQNERWFHELVEQGLKMIVQERVAGLGSGLLDAVREGDLTPTRAASKLLTELRSVSGRSC